MLEITSPLRARPNDDWTWPLPILNGFAPVIVEHDPSRHEVVIGYGAGVALPQYVPVFAVRAGTITYAATTSTGYQLCVSHAGNWSTRYDGLERIRPRRMNWIQQRRVERVAAGDVLGFLGFKSPRLGFELGSYRDGAGVVSTPTSQRGRHWIHLQLTARPPSLGNYFSNTSETT